MVKKHSNKANKGSKTGSKPAGILQRTRRLIVTRARLVLALGVVGLLGLGLHSLWQHYEPSVIHRQRYLVPGERITISPPPAWILSDIRGEVVRDAGLDGRLSILEDDFVQTVKDAFALHPWVASVNRITKSFPPAVHVELTYRMPVAVVEMPTAGGAEWMPLDKLGIRLPTSDVPLIRRRYLPRISGIVGQPPVGQQWDDPRVAGAAELASRLAHVWQSLHLVDILPSARPEIVAEHRYFVFNLITRGGTRIVWGAAPNSGPPGEANFFTKLQRLEQCADRLGPLDSAQGPAVVDIRQGLVVTPRTAKKQAPKMANKRVPGKEEKPVVK